MVQDVESGKPAAALRGDARCVAGRNGISRLSRRRAWKGSRRNSAANSPIAPTSDANKGANIGGPDSTLYLVKPPGRCLIPRQCKYVPCTPLSTIAALLTGSTVLAARREKNPAAPAGIAVGTTTIGHHIILLPKLAPSWER